MEHTVVDASLGLARKLLAGVQLDGPLPPGLHQQHPSGAAHATALAPQLHAFLAASSGTGSAQAPLDGLLEALRAMPRVPNADPPPFKLLQLLLLPEIDPPGPAAWCVESRGLGPGTSPMAITPSLPFFFFFPCAGGRRLTASRCSCCGPTPAPWPPTDRSAPRPRGPSPRPAARCKTRRPFTHSLFLSHG